MPRKVFTGVDFDEGFDDYDDYDEHDYDEESYADGGSQSQPTKKATNPRVWGCSICTYDNEESMIACDICGVLRKPLVQLDNSNNQKAVGGMCKGSGASKMATSLFASLPHQTPKNDAVLREQIVDFLVDNGQCLYELGSIQRYFNEFHEARSSHSQKHVNIAPFSFNIPSPDDVVSNGLQSLKKGSLKEKDSSTTKLSSNLTEKNLKTKSKNNTSKDVPSDSKAPGSYFTPVESTLSMSNPSKQGSARNSSSTKLAKNRSNDDSSKGITTSGSSSTSFESSIATTSNSTKIGLSQESHQEDKFSNRNTIEATSAAPYQAEKWMLRDKEDNDLTQLNLAIVGHVDSGKSTLSGRLLHLLGRISQKQMHKFEKEAKLQGKGSFAYAWALDESLEERERGITMTVAVAYFDTKNYHVVVLDSPGHKDFVPNMISGATQADAAILVIDASIGAFETGIDGSKGQTREHAQLIRSFGVEQLIVAVNKMDVVEDSKDRFDLIKQQLGTFLRACGFKDPFIMWIPLSAADNQNLVAAPSDVRLSSWYKGPFLLDAIDSLQSPMRDLSKPLLMPICDVVKSQSNNQVSACGKLEAGALKIGSKVIIMPLGDVGTVKSLERDSRPCIVARAGDNVSIVLQGMNEVKVMTGDVLCHPDYPVSVSSHFELRVVILDGSPPILMGTQLEFHIHHAKAAGRVVKILSLLDPKTGKATKKAPRCLTAKQNAVLEVVLSGGSVCAEEYSNCKALGRVSLRSLGRTVAVGVVTRLIHDDDQE